MGRHRPVQPRQPQQARDEARRLSQRQAEQDLDREARLNGGVREGVLPSALARRYTGCQAMPGSSQIVSEPHSRNDAS